MSGSFASNLGYGNITPGTDINPRYVNVSDTHNQGNFGNRVIPGMPNLPGLTGAQWGVDAAKGYVPGIAVWKGGLKKKIKNITKMYKMKDGKKRMRTMKRKVKRHVHTYSCTKYGCKHMHRHTSKDYTCKHKHSTHCNKFGCKHMHTNSCRKKSKSKKQRGGYAQYQNNLPITGVYSTGGVLPANELGLANPTPYQPLSNCVNCMDNYNHYLGDGFPSKGH
jgi:hypothetical protein